MFGDATFKNRSHEISRRRFVQGLVASGLVASFDLWRWPGLAAAAVAEPAVLTGSHFDLVVDEMPVNFTRRSSVATAINGSVPGPLLKWREGDTVTISVTNRLKVPTSIHWHGVRSPADMDGVPGPSFPGIAAGQTFTYTIPVKQHGTYWYHSHSRFQEQTGHYGPLVIEPRDKDPNQCDRDYVIVLSDWTDEDPETILTNLKGQSDYYNYHQRTVGTFFSDVRKKGTRSNGVRPSDVGPHEHEPHRHSGRERRDLHLPDQWTTACRQLDSIVQPARAGPSALHQRLIDEHLRRAHPRIADDGGADRWQRCRAGRGR